jgi:hypothetical protein
MADAGDNFKKRATIPLAPCIYTLLASSHNESDEVSLGFFSKLQDLGTYVLSKEDWYGSYFCCVGKF